MSRRAAPPLPAGEGRRQTSATRRTSLCLLSGRAPSLAERDIPACAAAAAAAAALVALAHFASFAWRDHPLVTDVRHFVYFAQQTAQGALPHLDFFDNKTPLATFAGKT